MAALSMIVFMCMMDSTGAMGAMATVEIVMAGSTPARVGPTMEFTIAPVDFMADRVAEFTMV